MDNTILHACKFCHELFYYVNYPSMIWIIVSYQQNNAAKERQKKKKNYVLNKEPNTESDQYLNYFENIWSLDILVCKVGRPTS